MTTARFAPEERIGLVAAVVLHVALLAAIMLRPALVPPPPEVERVTVSLAEDVGLTAAAPDPVPESREAVAPTLAPEPAPPVAAPPPPFPAPRPVATRPPPPKPVASRAPPPRPAATRAPPQPRQTAAPQPQRASTDPRRRPDKPQSQPAQPKPGGASRIGKDFLPGAGASATSNETRPPAATFGAAEQAALQQAINRQLQPHWRGKTPQGVDTEKLVTIVTWRLNPDGSLAGAPQVVRQEGVNDANRAQAPLHAEAAIRAVRSAAPFKLPPQFYDKWSYIRSWRFDRRL